MFDSSFFHLYLQKPVQSDGTTAKGKVVGAQVNSFLSQRG